MKGNDNCSISNIYRLDGRVPVEKQSRLACIIFLVSAAETIGDTSAMVSGGLNREITGEEIQGSLACDGYSSAMSSLFGCPPLTSFSQNVGLVAMTKVVNRFTIMMFGTILSLVLPKDMEIQKIG